MFYGMLKFIKNIKTEVELSNKKCGNAKCTPHIKLSKVWISCVLIIINLYRNKNELCKYICMQGICCPNDSDILFTKIELIVIFKYIQLWRLWITDELISTLCWCIPKYYGNSRLSVSNRFWSIMFVSIEIYCYDLAPLYNVQFPNISESLNEIRHTYF
jgi:hypothetical protein